MKTRDFSLLVRSRSAFTMIEMIGVLAIMAILAAVLVPNLLKSIERAAVRAETETLSSLGTQIKAYLRDNGGPPNSAVTHAPPAASNWTAQIALYASLSQQDILTNKRQQQRIYVLEPVVAPAIPQRALLISSMRPAATLPNPATIRNNFSNIWGWFFDSSDPTPDAPAGFNAAVWTADSLENYLVIERINFRDIYSTQLRTFSVTLTSSDATAVAYVVRRADGTIKRNGNVSSAGPVNFMKTDLVPLVTGDRIDLNRDGPPVALDYSYILRSADVTFTYDGTHWKLSE